MKIQLTHTYNDIISLENLLLAWEEFIIGKRSKPDVQLFDRNLMDNILALHTDLVNHTYKHSPYHSFYITDPKRRHIHKATVRDRLLHHAIYRILYPFFDKTFIADSFSCRNNKGMHKAINRFREFVYQVSRNHTRTCWVLKCDIKQFFASIDHRILLKILEEYIPDQAILGLLKNIIGSFSERHPERSEGSLKLSMLDQTLRDSSLRYGCVQNDVHLTGEIPVDKGLPLGNLTSQLFSNIYLNQLDQWVKHQLKAPHYIRYADDFIFLSEDRSCLVEIIPQLQHFLADQLRLTLHPKKLFIKTIASGVDFLGWVHFSDHRVVRSTTRRRMFKRVQEHPTKETLQSYLGLLSHGNARGLRERVVTEWWLWNDGGEM